MAPVRFPTYFLQKKLRLPICKMKECPYQGSHHHLLFHQLNASPNSLHLSWSKQKVCVHVKGTVARDLLPWGHLANPSPVRIQIRSLYMKIFNIFPNNDGDFSGCVCLWLEISYIWDFIWQMEMKYMCGFILSSPCAEFHSTRGIHLPNFNLRIESTIGGHITFNILKLCKFS